MTAQLPILLAEDEESDILILQHALKRAECPNELLVARDGQEAVDQLAQMGSRPGGVLPGLVILDLKMPRMDGFEVLAWITAHGGLGDVPVIVLTSSTDQADMRKALQLGARGFYVKPDSLQGLVELLRRIQARWLGAAPEGSAQTLAA